MAGGNSAIGSSGAAGDTATLEAALAQSEKGAVTHEVKVPTGDGLGTSENEAQRIARIMSGANPSQVFRTEDEKIGGDPSVVPTEERRAKPEAYVNPRGVTVREGIIPGQRRNETPEPDDARPPQEPGVAPSPSKVITQAPAAPAFDEAALKKDFGIVDPVQAKPEDELARLREENARGKHLWREGVNELRSRPVDSLLDDLKVDPQAILAGMRARGLLHEQAPAVSALPEGFKIPEDASDLEKNLIAENAALKGKFGTLEQQVREVGSRIAQKDTAEQNARRDADVARRYGALAHTVASKLTAIPAFQGEKQRVDRIVENVLLRTQRDAGTEASAEEIAKIGLQHAFDEVRMTLASPKAIVAAEAARGVSAPVPTSAGETVRPISGGARQRSVNFANDDDRRLSGLAALRELAGD